MIKRSHLTHPITIFVLISIIIFLSLTILIGRDLIFNRPIADYIPFYTPTLTSIPADYKDCSQYHNQNSLNPLKCSLSFLVNDKLFQNCVDNGGNLTSDSSGEQSCNLVYYNYYFSSWPKSFDECNKIFGVAGNPNMCGGIIPDSGVYQYDQNKDQVNGLVDECLNAGGSTILLAGKDTRFCATTFNK